MHLQALLSFALLLAASPVKSQAPCGYSGAPEMSIVTLPACADPSDMRRRLYDRGIDSRFVYTNDLLSNVSGGAKTGTIDQGKLEWVAAANLEKIWGWKGLRFQTNTFFLHNTGFMRRDYTGSINTIAEIEANPSVRLSEIWFEQDFPGAQLSIRAGQLAADTEFFFSNKSTFFLNSDWPTITALNLPSGGPAYPLSTPGIRLRYSPADDLSFLLAVYNGDPSGPGRGDEQTRNPHGLNFRVNDPPFVIGEVQYRYGAELAGMLKLGAWQHFGHFNDRRFSTDGASLADPVSNGIPVRYRGNWGIYGVIDQQIYRTADGDNDKGIFVFTRMSASPSDRNPISFYADFGIIFSGLNPARPNDAFGASAMVARFSDRLRAFDRDNVLFTGSGIVRDYEANLEVSYRAQIVPGWIVQPVYTHIWHPGGGLKKNASIFGARTIIQY